MSEIAALCTKLTTGLNRTPSTDFERVLARFDELRKLRADRELSKEERRIYNKLARYIYAHFEATFNQIDEKMVGRRQQRQQQRGGQGGGAGDEKSENNDNYLMNIWKWVKDKYEAFMESIRQTAEENQRKALEAVTPANMMKILGMTDTGVPNVVADQITGIDNKIKDALAAIQKTVTHGVGNAASAAIDVFLNALSMMPVFGTALLTWRIFQNLLVIVGASMSVQATNVSVGREVLAGIEEAKKGPAVIKKLEEQAEKKDLNKEENSTKDPTQDPTHKDPKLSVPGLGDTQDTLSNSTKGVKDNAQGTNAQDTLINLTKGAQGNITGQNVNAAAGKILKELGGGTRKTKNRNSGNRDNRGNNIASYARKIQQSLKRFHKLGAPNHRKYNYAPPTATTAYALKLA